MAACDNGRLCNTCIACFGATARIAVGSNGSHHLSSTSLDEAAKQGCYICTRVLQAKLNYPVYLGPFGELHTTTYKVLPYGQFDQSRYLEIKMNTDKTPLSITQFLLQIEFPYAVKPLPSSTGSAQTIELIGTWLRRCQAHHLHCRVKEREIFHMPAIDGTAPRTLITNVKALPTRLLRIERALDSSDMRARICYGRDLYANSQYLSLSHAWGEEKFTTLTRSNHDQFVDDIPLILISQTFRDAIYVTYQMGFTYLWIDSLCIVQDDLSDWEREAKNMANVYKHAICNLSASGFTASNRGFLVPSRVENPIPPTLNFDEPILEERFLVSDIAPWRSLHEAPLFRRAWVLQEQVLATRTVHFDQNQVHWECHEAYANEAMPLGLTAHNYLVEERTRNRKDLLDQTRVSPFQLLYHQSLVLKSYWHFSVDHTSRVAFNIYDVWRSLVTDYSSRQLTYASDRLPALDGLVSEFTRLTHGDFYMYGLWNRDILRQLLWNCDLTRQLLLHTANENNSTSTPVKSHIPSWSWAASGGPVGWSAALFVGYNFSSLQAVSEIASDEVFTTPHIIRVTGYPFRLRHNDQLYFRDLRRFRFYNRTIGFSFWYIVDHWYYKSMNVEHIPSEHGSLTATTIILPLFWNSGAKFRGANEALCLLLEKDRHYEKGLYRRVGVVNICCPGCILDTQYPGAGNKPHPFPDEAHNQDCRTYENFKDKILNHAETLDDTYYLDRCADGRFVIGIA